MYCKHLGSLRGPAASDLRSVTNKTTTLQNIFWPDRHTPHMKPRKMNFDWTPLSAFPKELYRVCRTGQKTAFIRPHGFLAANQDVSYFGTSQIPAFIQSIISHRRQDRIISPYISFFEDLCEAQQWCLAAEEVFGGNPTVAVINLKSPAFKYGIEERRIHGWRVVEVVQRLGLEDTILGMGAGSPRIESEWMFIGRVPEETVIKQITCDQIRRGKL